MNVRGLEKTEIGLLKPLLRQCPQSKEASITIGSNKEDVGERGIDQLSPEDAMVINPSSGSQFQGRRIDLKKCSSLSRETAKFECVRVPAILAETARDHS
jgi:hypothetical protein